MNKKILANNLDILKRKQMGKHVSNKKDELIEIKDTFECSRPNINLEIKHKPSSDI
jgi:hypothetical protein